MHRAARWSLRGVTALHSDSQTRNTGSRERNADSEAAHARTTVRRAAMYEQVGTPTSKCSKCTRDRARAAAVGRFAPCASVL